VSLFGKTKKEIDDSDFRFVSMLEDEFKITNIKAVFECEWKNFKKTDEWKDFVVSTNFNSCRPLNRLIPRVAMRSGFSDLYRLNWKQSDHPNEIFKVADVNMLYSHIALTEHFGVGKPTILIGKSLKEISIKNDTIHYKGNDVLSGAVYCSILAPQNELYPFLPFRVSNKFNYLSSCKSCCDKLRTKCKHKVLSSKMFTSTWTVPEINKALKEGYQLIEIYEIVIFTERKPILKSFVQSLLVERISNSGGINDDMSFDEKNNYCKKHNDRMNLPPELYLVPEKITDNPSQKEFYKDCLNSLYGKFSANLIKTKTEIVRIQHRLEEIAHFNEIVEIFPINDSNLLVEYELKDLKPNFKGNIFIGSEITAHARIYMHNYLKQLQNIPGAKIFQIETDSIMYSIPKNVIDPLPYSDLIGDFKHVVPENCDIQSFFALGNKNYSILYKDENEKVKTILKVKGLSLKSSHINHPISNEIYNDYIESHFKNEVKNVVIPQLRTFKGKTNAFNETRFRTFEFKNDLYLKRYVKQENTTDYVTLPYGYCD